MSLDATNVGSNRDGVPTFEQFEASTYKEAGPNGVYIVNGDEPIENIKKLREYYDMLYGDGGLIVNLVGGQDDKWNSQQQTNLTYCVSDSFGSHKQAVLDAIAQATDNGWETFANVNFIHDATQDANCTASNNNVVFDVNPTSGQAYLARAFFPNQSRATRNVMVDSSAFTTSWPLSGILGHELGHALGFRHEHTRPEAGQCYEDNNWRPLTPYDSASIMHYPQCGGTGTPLTFTQYDADGAKALYGPPAGSGGGGGTTDPGTGGGGGTDPGTGGGGGGTTPPPPPPPSTGTPQTGSDSGTLQAGQWANYQPLDVLGGTMVDVGITGSGDADLYVRFDAAPTAYQFDCRPYLNGSSESCSLDVPAGASQVYISVNGYAAASYNLTVSWTSP